MDTSKVNVGDTVEKKQVIGKTGGNAIGITVRDLDGMMVDPRKKFYVLEGKTKEEYDAETASMYEEESESKTTPVVSGSIDGGYQVSAFEGPASDVEAFRQAKTDSETFEILVNTPEYREAKEEVRAHPENTTNINKQLREALTKRFGKDIAVPEVMPQRSPRTDVEAFDAVVVSDEYQQAIAEAKEAINKASSYDEAFRAVQKMDKPLKEILKDRFGKGVVIPELSGVLSGYIRDKFKK